MQKLDGVWWTLNHNQIPGILTITDDNVISLMTYEKLHDSNIVNGFVKGQPITLVDVELDRTDIYYKEASKKEDEYDITNKIDMKYSNYKYIAQAVIFGHAYERKGDIRLTSLELDYTNLDRWVDWKSEIPNVKNNKERVSLEFKPKKSIPAKIGKFNISIVKPYKLTQTKYNIKINNKTLIFIDNIANQYIQSVQEIIRCIQFFLVLCMGDNINVQKIQATDIFDRQIEIILGYGKSNYENRYIFKNIIKYKDIENSLERIIKKWLEVYQDNELLIASFINIQTKEELMASEYNNLMTAIDSVYLLITGKMDSKEPFAEKVKTLLRETNFILKLSEDEIKQIAIKVKDARRYFIHSNKTQRALVASNINGIKLIMSILIEVLRARIMMYIGIDEKPIREYYESLEELKKVKIDIINNIDEDDEIMSEKIENDKKIIKPLSKKEKDEIAELNAIMGTRYREIGYDLESTQDLIEAVENFTAEFIDYNTYWLELESILENFDQSIEVFNPANLMRMTKESGSGNELIDNTIASLYEATDNMYELTKIAEEKCREIWKVLLLRNKKEVKEHFLGEAKEYSEEQVTEAIEMVIQNIFEIGHRNVVSEDCENFANKIKEALEEVENEKV